MRGASYSLGLAVLISASAFALPQWFLSLATIAMGTGLAALGLLILWRAGLMSFGQGLYFATGAYAVALMVKTGMVQDAILLILAGAAGGGVVAFLVGFLLARYRQIFFAMLSLALSMILYGVLVHSAALGSTDGLHVRSATFLGTRLAGGAYVTALFLLACAIALTGAVGVKRYLNSIAGALAEPILDNEIRVEYLGASVRSLVHTKIVIAGILTGAGGGLTALSVGHVDPNMAYWTTSGGFVFVAVLAGTSSVGGAMLGAFLFEIARSTAMALTPGAWQFLLGSVLLLIIIFVPDGIGSLFARSRQAGSVR